MKWTLLTSLIMMTFLMVSCGDDKNESGGGSHSNAFSTNPTTQNGYYNSQNHVIEVGSQSYPPNQQYAMVMNQAIQQAQAQQTRPVMIHGVSKYRARFTGYMNHYNQGLQSGINAGYNTGHAQGTLILTNVQFY